MNSEADDDGGRDTSRNTLVQRARARAQAAHAGQMRKDGLSPFITHPTAVARHLERAGCGPEVVAAGLLHDTIEDTALGAADIEAEFGAQVRRLVEQASEPDKSLGWFERKRHTLETLEALPIDAKRIIAADKLHNIETLGELIEREGAEGWKLFRASEAAQAWYYGTIARKLSTLDEPLFDALAEAVAKLFGAQALEGLEEPT